MKHHYLINQIIYYHKTVCSVKIETKKASSIASRNSPIIREDSLNIPYSGERAVSLVENAVVCEWMNVDTFSDIYYDID